MMLLCVACGHAPTPGTTSVTPPPPAPREAPPDAAVTVDAATEPDAAVDVAAVDVTTERAPIEAYTDDAAVALLAADPRWSMPNDSEEAHGCEGDVDPQSCDPDPCHEGMGRRCRHGCRDVCTGCERTCRQTLTRCLTGAQGDARVACARTGAACIEGCIQHKDQCLTGYCAPRQLVCERAQERRFHEGPCHAVCARCTRQCEGSDLVGDCYAACFRRNPGCDAGQRPICVMAGPNYGAPQAPP